MTQDEIIEMARQAKLLPIEIGPVVETSRMRNKIAMLEAFAKLVAAKEREECAKAFEAEADTWIAWSQSGSAKRKGAEAIRARGQAAQQA